VPAINPFAEHYPFALKFLAPLGFGRKAKQPLASISHQIHPNKGRSEVALKKNRHLWKSQRFPRLVRSQWQAGFDWACWIEPEGYLI